MIELLRKVDFLAPLDDETLAELVTHGKVAHYRRGARIVSELESGADVFVLVKGQADVFVESRAGEQRILQTLSPGSAFGEMSSVTGELRSATVVATGAVEVLVIRDADFDRLRERRPEVAVAMLRTLANRLAEADRSVDALFDQDAIAAPAETVERGSIRRLWHDLVVTRRRDLAFMTLVAFVLTLVAVRLLVYISFRNDFAPRGVLRAAYMGGFTLLFSSSAVALLTFRPLGRRLVAIAYGIGVALIFNELGVTLAFDIFYKDIHTRDPNFAFDVERLYRRTEAMRAIAIGLAVLVQTVYLRRFYRRVWFIVRTRARKLVG